MRFDRRELAAIFAGGCVGAVARAELAQALPTHRGEWPWATFTVNIVGAFLLGYFTTRLQERLPLSSYRRPLLGTGFCGGLTTFSTMQVELLRMLDADDFALAAAYALVSVTLGFLVVAVATNLVRRGPGGGGACSPSSASARSAASAPSPASSSTAASPAGSAASSRMARLRSTSSGRFCSTCSSASRSATAPIGWSGPAWSARSRRSAPGRWKATASARTGG